MTRVVATTPMTIMPRRAAIVPPPLPTAKPVTRATTTMTRISLLASRRNADVAGSSTRMKTSSCVRYDCRTSSGVGRIRERTGCRREGPAPRLATPEAREELRTAMDHVRHEAADVAEEGPDGVGRAARVPVDEDDDKGNREPDEPLPQIDRHLHHTSRADAAARLSAWGGLYPDGRSEVNLHKREQSPQRVALLTEVAQQWPNRTTEAICVHAGGSSKIAGQRP